MKKLIYFKNIFLLIIISMANLHAVILNGVHPRYDLVDLRQSDWKPLGIGGMDWLPDGRLAVAVWGLNRLGNNENNQTSLGQVLILSGVMGNGPQDVNVEVIAQGLSEPMGLTVIDGEIYVSERQEPDPSISKFVFNGSQWVKSVAYQGWGVNEPYHWHIFNFGLEYKDGYLWFCPGSRLETKGGPERGNLLRVDLKNQTHKVIVGGLRAPNGLGIGPEYGFWAPDNEGTWLSHSKMIHLVEGRWYGHVPDDYAIAEWPSGIGVANSQNRTEWPSTAILSHDGRPGRRGSGDEPGRSPTEPMYMTEGIYSGQFLAGDIYRGGLQRYFLEKVNGNWQAAVFDFTQGLECGVNRLMLGQDSKSIIMGGAGSNDSLHALGYTDWDSWSWQKKIHGFQKLVPNGNPVFEMLAVRSMGSSTFEIEYTEPAGSEAATVSNYVVETHTWTPNQSYGGGRFVDRHNLTVNSATLSTDGYKATLDVSGLKVNYIVKIHLNNIKSAAGDELWTPDVWYTLTQFGPGEDPGLNALDVISGRNGISLGHPKLVDEIVPDKGTFSRRQVLQFDGQDDEIHIQPLVMSGDFSITARFKITDMRTENPIIGSKHGPVIKFTGEELQLVGPGGVLVASLPSLTPHFWQYLVMTRQGDVLTLYVDGSVVGTGSFPGEFTSEYIGSGSSGFLQGEIDEIRIHNRALTQSEVTLTHIDRSQVGGGLMHRWQFDSTDASVDISQNGKNNLQSAKLNVSTGTTIKIEIDGKTPLEGKLEILDISGREIKTLKLNVVGNKQIALWENSAETGRGVYFARFSTNHFSLQERFILVK